MEFSSKKGITFCVVFVLWCAMTAALIVITIVAFNAILAIVSGLWVLALFLYFIPAITRKTMLEFKDDHLFIKSGKHEQKIPYSRITGVSRGVKSMLMETFTSSFKRVEIKFTSKSGATETTHISPKNESEFVRLLDSKI